MNDLPKPDWLTDKQPLSEISLALREVDYVWLHKRARRLGYTVQQLLRVLVARQLQNEVDRGTTQVTRRKKGWKVTCR